MSRFDFFYFLRMNSNMSFFHEIKKKLINVSYCSLRRVGSHAHAQAHAKVSLRVQFIAQSKVISLFVLLLFIFPVRRTFPNVVYTSHGKLFCLNC